ncbi:MAG TPA: serine/threonine-protein kinase [Gemmatimonadales bacterium]|jgi:serine/threonine-protein kinase
MTDQPEIDEYAEEQLRELRAALADTYDVERELGQGGMATVYLARDLKHDRYVAIKVILPDLAQSLGADRFLREVQITAKLQHPHILPLYDSGEADGKLYYVMPFVEGESLGDRIERDKQLPIKDAVLICKEVAEALGYAHSLGLVHRDIKPDNIMMTGGHAVVADFGIARAMDAAGGEKITQTGMAVGTPAYMSPEQASGENVDGRSDLYSLGCVLYEMLIGQVPFTGPTPMAIMARHAMDTVPAPTIMREAIPDELEDVIMTSMAKTPADRYQTGMEMAEALDMVDVHTAMHRRPSAAMRQSGMMAAGGRTSRMMAGQLAEPASAWRRALVSVVGVVAVAGIALGAWAVFGPGGGSVLGDQLDPERVAVLYFEDLSSDGSLGPIADGLTEALIDELDRADVSVVSASGAARFRDTRASRDSVARALGAGTLVVGQLESRSGGNVLISTRLVDGNTGDNVGNLESFTVGADQIISARDSVAAGVTTSLRARIGRNVALRASRLGTRSNDAYVAYRRGERSRQEAAERRAADDHDGVARALNSADSLFQLAERADPRWGDPIVARGWTALERARYLGGDLAVVIQEAIGHAERAVTLDNRNAKALELRGTLKHVLANPTVTPDMSQRPALIAAARADLEQATSLDPTLASAYVTLSVVYYEPEIDEVPLAMAAAQAGLERDPYLRGTSDLIDRAFWGAIDLQQATTARRWCTEGFTRFPDDVRFKLCQLWLMVVPGAPAPDVARAATLIDGIGSLPTASADTTVRLQAMTLYGGIVGKAGLADSADRVLDRVREAAADPEIDPEWEIRTVEAYARHVAGDNDEAIEILKRYIVANPHHRFVESQGNVWWWQELARQPRWSELTLLGR